MNVGTSLLIQMFNLNALTHESVMTLCLCSDDIKVHVCCTVAFTYRGRTKNKVETQLFLQ